MPPPKRRPRAAVLSPFVDKSHATERCVAEQMERLAGEFEIHLYCSRVEDLDLSQITWHRVPIPPAPRLIRYVWFLAANGFCRWRDRTFRGLAPDVLYSPGVNCLKPDVVSVHVLFSKVRQKLAKSLELRNNPMKAWPVTMHRRIYYRLAEYLEGKVYSRAESTIVAVSQKAARDIETKHGEGVHPRVIYYGVDAKRFCSVRRMELRGRAREALGMKEETFAILLIGNDWVNKGLPCLLEAVGMLRNPQIHILVVGQDSLVAYRNSINRMGLDGKVSFLPLRNDVEFYYAAADAYAGPSLEDTFSLPVAEAMACGLPVIVSRAAGVSEIIHHGEDGLVLENPADARTLSEMIGRLCDDPAWRDKLGKAATVTAGKYTWERNARELGEILNSIVVTRHSLPMGSSMADRTKGH